MGTKIVVTLFIIICILFLLSVFAPMHSEKKFWVVIHRIRDVMDLISYWIINLIAIAVILYMVVVIISGLISR